MKILFIGDVYAQAGREYLKEMLPILKEKYKYQILIVNGENSGNLGRGINQKIYKEFMEMNVSAITMGNHTFSMTELEDFIDHSKVVRPCNYHHAPGKGYYSFKYNSSEITVINAMGRTFMNAPLDDPFTSIDQILENTNSDYYIVDFHAEATSEKIALGWYLDGRVNAVLGTHTHVQTNDLRELDHHTVYISDVGMTGPYDGIIGVDRDIVIPRFLNGYSKPNKPATGKVQLNGVFLDLTDPLKPKYEKINLIKE